MAHAEMVVALSIADSPLPVEKRTRTLEFLW